MDKQANISRQNNTFSAGAIACGPTILGYWSIGFAAGAIGSLSGFSLTDITLLSALLYAGSAQFLFYSLWAGGAGTLAIVLAVLLVNIRYLLMSSFLARFFAALSAPKKFISGMLLTDETFAVAAQYAGKYGQIPFRWMSGLNVTAYINWIIANIIGALFASYIPAEISQRLGFSLTAMFIGLLALNYYGSKYKKLEIIAMTVSAAVVLATLGVLNVNISLLVATAVAATLCATIIKFTAARGAV